MQQKHGPKQDWTVSASSLSKLRFCKQCTAPKLQCDQSKTTGKSGKPSTFLWWDLVVSARGALSKRRAYSSKQRGVCDSLISQPSINKHPVTFQFGEGMSELPQTHASGQRETNCCIKMTMSLTCLCCSWCVCLTTGICRCLFEIKPWRCTCCAAREDIRCHRGLGLNKFLQIPQERFVPCLQLFLILQAIMNGRVQRAKMISVRDATSAANIAL